MRTFLYSMLFALTVLPAHAAIVNFGTLSSGTGTIGAASNTTLNTSTGNNGFDNFFTTPYNSLGATAAQITSDFPEFGISRISSTSSFLGSVLNNTGSNRLTFNYAFDGSALFTDNYRAFWCTVATCTAPTIVSTFSTFATISSGGAFFSGSVGSGFVDTTNYFLVFELNEDSGRGNSAAGFNNVQLIPEPTTTVGLLLLGLGGLARKFKRN